MATAFAPAAAAGDLKVTSLISVGHFFSHLYILVLPPIFPVLQEALGVSATALGVALAALNVVTMFCQAPTGFLVDRLGPARILIAGHFLFAAAIACIGLIPGYGALVLFMVAAGLGNAVYHPADYAILAARVSEGRVGRAFSFHTFGGYLGFAAAPLSVVPLTAAFGWQWALVILGLAGITMGLILLANRDALTITRPAPVKGGRGDAPSDRRLLMSLPILLSLLFFVLLAASHSGFTSFSPMALVEMYGFELVQANLPLTAFLVISAAGVLLGGMIADRTQRHALVVAASSLTIALAATLVAAGSLPLWALVAVFLVAGLASGVIAPSRDMLVRAVTPPGASGKVFGFVMTGFNIGSLILPPAYGLSLDLQAPRLVFWGVALFSVLTLVTLAGAGRARAASGPA
jgi:FSR family fosmidomycin resistance protein-like MFS transporter